MRVYLPATFDYLAALADDGSVSVAGGWGFAVTPDLEAFYSAGGDEEEIAHAAFMDAARASLRLLTTPPEILPHRRVVIAADCDDAKVTAAPEMGESVVRLSPAVVSLDEVVSFHVDVADNETTTAAAIDVVDAADLEDTDAELIVGDALDRFLAWYDVNELAVLLAGAS